MPSSGPKAAKTSLRCGAVSLSSVSSSWLRRKIAQRVVGRDRRQLTDHGLQRLGLLARKRQPQVLVDAGTRTACAARRRARRSSCARSLQADVDLAEQHRVAAPAVGERAQAAQPFLRVVRVDLLGQPGGLEQRRHRVHAEARDAQREPEADDARDLVADRGIGDVEVGLEVSRSGAGSTGRPVSS